MSSPNRLEQPSGRERLIDAVVAEVAERGYGQLRMAPLAKRAEVSHSTFYASFEDKEDLFLSAYAHFAQRLLGTLTAAARDAKDPSAAIDAVVATLLRWYADRPAAARSLLVEVLAAGPRALDARAAVLERFVDGLEALVGPEVPRVAVLALVATADELARDALRRGAAHELPALHDELRELALRVLA